MGLPGAICSSTTANTTRFTNASIAGAKKADGKLSLSNFKNPTWTGSGSIQPPFGRTNLPPVKNKYRRGRSLRAFAGWLFKQTACGGRCPGESTPVSTYPRAGSRHQPVATVGPYKPGAVIADKGYDSEALLTFIHSKGAEAVIPARRNRREKKDR